MKKQKINIGDVIYLEQSGECMYVDESWYNSKHFEHYLLPGERFATDEEKKEHLKKIKLI